MKPVATTEPALAWPRLLRRASVGLAVRGGQGALLGLSIAASPEQVASDLALLLAVVTGVNVMSNLGIPTLIVRKGRGGLPETGLGSLLRAYVVMSLVAAVLSGVVVGGLTGSRVDGALAATFCLSLSLYSGAEYWMLGRGTGHYDRFLRRSGTTQAIGCLAAPAGYLATGSTGVGVLLLAAGCAAGATLAAFGEGGPGAIRRLLRPRLQLRSWWRSALGVGTGTALAGAVYMMDTVTQQVAGAEALLPTYRLAVMVVAFMVALLPVNLFVLADSAAGRSLDRRLLTRISAAYVVAVGGIGAVALWTVPGAEQFGAVLLAVLPLVVVRLWSQALVSSLNARGLPRVVVGSFGLGLLLWCVVLGACLRLGVSLAAFAPAQVAVEASILALLVAGGALGTRDVGAGRSPAPAPRPPE